jgi:NIPSNAP
MLYEIRLYNLVPGRILDNLNRWEQHLPRLMARHGISVMGRWIATAGPGAPMFIYMMTYESLQQREDQWAGFYADADWWEARALTNAGSQIVERFETYFLRSNKIGPAPGNEAGQEKGVCELTFVDVKLGHNAEAEQILRDHVLPLIERNDGIVTMVADFVAGPSMPRMGIMVAWPDANAFHTSRLKITTDAAFLAAQKRERDTMERPSLGRTDTYLLEPVSSARPLRRSA